MSKNYIYTAYILFNYWIINNFVVNSSKYKTQVYNDRILVIIKSIIIDCYLNIIIMCKWKLRKKKYWKNDSEM